MQDIPTPNAKPIPARFSIHVRRDLHATPPVDGKEPRQEWRWHFRSGGYENTKGQIICTSGEPFYSKSQAVKQAKSFSRKLNMPHNFWVHK